MLGFHTNHSSESTEPRGERIINWYETRMELTDNLIKHVTGHDSHPGYCLIPLLESETNTSTVSLMLSAA